MIEIFIFHLHIMAGLYAFTQRWREEGIKEGLLALAVIGLVFSIGWAITSALAALIAPGGLADWFTADTLSLVLLLVPEFFLFRMLFMSGRG